MSRGLLQLSGIVVDLVHMIDHLPGRGEEVETAPLLVTAGGGFNALAAARRQGASVAYGGTLGSGPFADMARRHLAKETIPVATARRADIDQGTCSVLVDRSGERSFISYHGAERRVDAGHLAALGAASFAWVLLSGYSFYKPQTAGVFLPWLHALGRPPLFLFDPGPVIGEIPPATVAQVLARADWVSANAREALVLTGSDSPARAAERLAAGRAGAIVRTGAEGCWLAFAGTLHKVDGFAVKAVDTNGAGDTHDGAFVAAMLRGLDPPAAARFANAAAALSTTRTGPATAPNLEDTRRLLEHGGTHPAATGQPQQEDRT